jgi:diguanylate cyclase (GGDEF)-like protein
MQQHELDRWFLAGEDWLIRRVLEYAKRQGYTRYTSTLEEAWRLSIRELTATLGQALASERDLAEFHPDESFADDPISAFAVLEADRHRERGIELKMFLGLFKYYRQAYLDRLMEADLALDESRAALQWVTRIFDRLEIAFCSAWADLDSDAQLLDLQQSNRAMTNEKNRFLTVTESLASPVILLDPRHRVSYVNLAAATLLGLPERPGTFYYHEGGLDLAVPGWLAAMLEQAEGSEAEWRGEHITGTHSGSRAFQVLIRPMLDVSDKFQGTVVILHDITALRRAESELALRASDLERLSHTDSLTGLLNRRGLQSAAGPALEQARRSGSPLSVLYGDVDDLKAINDRFGHAVGDQVLIALASALRHSVRAADLIARVGGDEMVIVLPDSADLDAGLIEQRLHDHLARVLSELDHDVTVRVSLGWVGFRPQRHATLADLLEEADQAMYRSKQDRLRRRKASHRTSRGVSPSR